MEVNRNKGRSFGGNEVRGFEIDSKSSSSISIVCFPARCWWREHVDHCSPTCFGQPEKNAR